MTDETPPSRSIHAHESHLGWDNSLPPVISIKAGSTVELSLSDASGGQLTPTSSATDVENLNTDFVNPLTGPIQVEGSGPGDVLRVSIRNIEISDWGWTANIPGFGLLADVFPTAALHIWSLDSRPGRMAEFAGGGLVPLRPFVGTIGVAPASPGLHDVVPPRRVGGNMDIRDLTEGTDLYLPVEVSGALLSLGDGHAAQGDGEVCGTAIETNMKVVVEIDVVSQVNQAFPYFVTTRTPEMPIDSSSFLATTGIGPDLMQCARHATLGMIELLVQRYGVSEMDAYMLCSVTGHLRISEIVDAPNWTVSAYFPLAVFERTCL